MKDIFNGKALDVKYEHDFREKKMREKTNKYICHVHKKSG